MSRVAERMRVAWCVVTALLTSCAEGVALDPKGSDPGATSLNGVGGEPMVGGAGTDVVTSGGNRGTEGFGGSTDGGPIGAGGLGGGSTPGSDATVGSRGSAGGVDAGKTGDEWVAGDTGAGGEGDALGACETISLTSSSDAFILGNEPNGNTGTSSQLAVTASGASSTRVFLSFTLDQVPVDARINTGELQLVVESSSGPARAIEVHRVDNSRPWTETGISWASYAPGKSWTAAGGDFAPAASASASISNADTTGTLRSWNVRADVQSFQTNRAQVSGWMIKDPGEPDGGSGEVVRFFSRETVHPPKLQIEFCR